MTCTCGSDRILCIGGKVSDMGHFNIPHLGVEHHGSMPYEITPSLCHGDYIEMEICMDCGRVQNFEPVTDDDVREHEELGELVDPDKGQPIEGYATGQEAVAIEKRADSFLDIIRARGKA